MRRKNRAVRLPHFCRLFEFLTCWFHTLIAVVFDVPQRAIPDFQRDRFLTSRHVLYNFSLFAGIYG